MYAVFRPTAPSTDAVRYDRFTSTPAGRFAQIAAIHRASVNFLSMLSRSVPEHINAVIDEEGLDKAGFAGKLSSERRKQSERNEGDDARQIGLWTTE